ncbi:hypothetical protein ES703_80077 [subsurface metagenome]
MQPYYQDPGKETIEECSSCFMMAVLLPSLCTALNSWKIVSLSFSISCFNIRWWTSLLPRPVHIASSFGSPRIVASLLGLAWLSAIRITNLACFRLIRRYGNRILEALAATWRSAFHTNWSWLLGVLPLRMLNDPPKNSWNNITASEDTWPTCIRTIYCPCRRFGYWMILKHPSESITPARYAYMVEYNSLLFMSQVYAKV